MVKSAAALRDQFGLMYDGPFPQEALDVIAEADRRERAAHEIAELMALPAEERFAALARREWHCMRMIWRFGNLADFRRVVSRAGPGYASHPQVRARELHLWREACDLTVPHLIAWAAFRDAHRKMGRAIERRAA